MRVCIYGAGAIGGYLAVGLAGSGVEVSLVARGPHLAAIRERGLTLRTAEGERTVRVAASENPEDLGPQRSEEHTSELQSLMRISYAVFCLKKKIKTQIEHRRSRLRTEQ